MKRTFSALALAVLASADGLPAQAGYRFGSCHSGSHAEYAELSIRSVYVTMRDGVRIALDLSLPANRGATQRFPAILSFTRYGRAASPKMRRFGEFLAAHGYASVRVDERGTGASFGRWRAIWSPESIQDAGAVVDWVIAQPWSTGLVGATGISYDGTTAELLAVTNHPAVRAIVPQFNDFDTYTFAFPGGIHLDSLVRQWSEHVHRLDQNTATGSPAKPVDADRDGRLLQQAVRDHATNTRVYPSLEGTIYRDDRSPANGLSLDDFSVHSYRAEIEKSRVPIYAWASWLDAETPDGLLMRFRTFSNPQRAVLGPWSHGGLYHASQYQPVETAVDPELLVQWMEIVCFFENYLKGRRNQLSQTGLAYYTMGEEEWKTTSVWPPRGSTTERWFFGAANTLSRTASTAATGADEYAVGFEATTGTSNRWHTNVAGGDIAYPDRVLQDRLLLTYTSAPLDSDLEITGHPVVTLYVTSTATDGAFFVYLEDVAPTGEVIYVTEGQLRAIHRKVSGDPPPYRQLVPNHSFKRKDGMPVVPGQVTTLSFGLYPTSVLVKRGHRLRVAIAGYDRDTFARIPAAGTPTIKVHRNRIHRSWIELPVIARK